MRFPEHKGKNLNGRKIKIPADLPGCYNLIITAFKRDHQTLVDSWIPYLVDLNQHEANFQFFEARDRTITMYKDKKTFRKMLHIPNESTIQLFLLDQEGDILWRTEGGYNDTAFISLLEILTNRHAQFLDCSEHLKALSQSN